MKSSLCIAVMVSMMTACATPSKLPSTRPTPQVDCRQPGTDYVPAPPVASIEEWVKHGPLWALDILDLLTQEREYRRVEHRCMDKLRGIQQ